MVKKSRKPKKLTAEAERLLRELGEILQKQSPEQHERFSEWLENQAFSEESSELESKDQDSTGNKIIPFKRK
jgi:hypothetical protein